MSGKVIQTRAELVAALRKSVKQLKEDHANCIAQIDGLGDQIAHTERLMKLLGEVKK